jgi:hypothetical protein
MKINPNEMTYKDFMKEAKKYVDKERNNLIRERGSDRK